MQLMKPKTYNELMQYKRCLELKQLVSDMDNDLFVKAYQHMLTSPKNSIGVSEGKMVFYEDEAAIESIAVTVASMVTAIRLSAIALNVERPISYYSSSDGGSSGNNNNNNNNNNNG